MAWLTTLPWGQLLINGIALGSLYALTAFGIVLIYKTTDVLTFGQGEMAMFSAFIAFTLLDRLKLPFPVAFVLTLVFALALGALVERVLMRRAQQGSVLNSIIVTIGLALVLVGSAGFIWGYEVRPFPDPVTGPPFLFRVSPTQNLVLTQLSAVILGVTLVLMLLLFAFFRFSLVGIAMRAVAQNRVAARLMGIPVDRINALGWGVGAALGAVTGMLIAPTNSLFPNMMGDVAIKAYAGAVLGGITSLPGAVVGGLLLGIIDSVAGFQAPELRTTIAFTLLVVVLVIRPAGLFGRRQIKKV